MPGLPGMRVQALHSHDAAQAYHLALTRDVRGPFNLAAEPVLDARSLAELLNARVIRLPRGLARAGSSAAW